MKAMRVVETNQEDGPLVRSSFSPFLEMELPGFDGTNTGRNLFGIFKTVMIG